MVYLDLVLNLALLVALSIVSNFIVKRWPRNTLSGVILQGLLFGGSAVLGMLRPLNMGPGLIFDGRSVMVSLCALYFGPWAGIISSAMTVACRILIGGAGLLTGILVILSSVLIGLLVRGLLKLQVKSPSSQNLYLFGLAVHLAMLALMFTLPDGAGVTVIKHIGLPVILLYPLATILSGKILSEQIDTIHYINALRESEEKHRLLLEESSDPIFSMTPEGKYSYANKAFAESVGVAVDSVIGKRIRDVLSEKEADRCSESVEEVLRSGEVKIMEVHASRPDFDRYYVTTITPIKDVAGEIISVMCSSKDITERKKTEKELEKQSIRRRTLFEQSPDGILIIDTSTGGFLEFNTAAHAQLGYTREEFAQLKISDIEARETAGDTQEHIARVIQNGKTDFETLQRTSQGETRNVHVTAQIVDVMGEPVYQCIWRDITERKRTEQEIVRFSRLIESSLNEIYIFDSETLRFINVNQGARENLGYTIDELRGMTPLDLKPEFTVEMFDRLIAPLRTGKEKVIVFKTFHRRKDKTLYPVEIHLQLMTEGYPVFVAFIFDITERKRAEEELKESEEKFRHLFHKHSAVKLIIDPADGRIVEANEAAVRFYGWPEEKLRQMFIQDINTISPELVKAEIEKAREQKRIYFEFQHRLADGSIRDVAVYTSVIDVKGQALLHFIIHDVTEHKQAEREKEKLQAQLNQAQKMESVGRLAGGVAHDFNNMLGIIIGHSELALELIDPSEPLYADIQEIRKAAERSANLTRQLLAFARRQTVAPKVLDLNETVEGMLKMLRRLIGEDIELTWIPGARVSPIKMDPSQIDQILANLCVNARDAIAGVGQITIETDNAVLDEAYCRDHAGYIPGEYVVLSLSDNGCGMDRETQDKLFEPFFTTKEIGKGTGLGLATVYGIVKQNNGCINVYSELGRGTTFKIYLPRYMAKTEEFQKERPVSPVPHGRESILLVEDEPEFLHLGQRMLLSLGYEVLAASTPGEAIRLAELHAGEIHLLITDVIMPEMNGRDLAKRVLSLYPGIKRLFMSGYTANVIAHHGVLDEGVHFIQKPFAMKELADKVRKVLDSERE